MQERFLIFAGIVAAGLIMIAAILSRTGHKNLPEKNKERLRRGGGHAMLGLQEFIAPSVEYVFQAQNVEQKEEDDDEGLGGDGAAIRSDLAEALSRTTLDNEEIRRHLSAARRAGIDWKALYEQAVAVELRDRPFRAPSIPPARRVAPRD
jgi:hypothetical protein